MPLTILSVGYPLAPAGAGAVGGAEQVMAALDRAIVRAGHRSIVIAPEGSRTDGELVPVPRASGVLDEDAVARARARHRAVLDTALRRTSIDIVHMHGIDFAHYLPTSDVPVLVTLHGPRAWYSSESLQPRRNVWLHCVSQEQHQDFAPHPQLLRPIENGVEAPDSGAVEKQDYALILSRIAPEKGVHLALGAAHKADVSLLIAGAVFDYPEHRRYFAQEITPRLDDKRLFLGPVEGRRKWRLLAGARCLLVASQIAETSSLVAREALTAGTPVIAYPAGALATLIEHGRTGFLVRTPDEMACAIREAYRLDPDVCRRIARGRFSAERMIAGYFSAYSTVLAAAAHKAAVA